MSTQMAGLNDLEGTAALPRSNGELVFEEPWEGSAFGLAVALCEGGVLEWETFRQRLIARIAGAQAAQPENWSYYVCWLDALQDVLAAQGVLDPADVESLAAEIIAREFHHDDDHSHHS
ncbi:nitrile hydratase accessory protein [Amycolatopsis sp. NPDC004368]